MKKFTFILALVFVVSLAFAQQVNKPSSSQMKANLTLGGQVVTEKAPVNSNNTKAYLDTVPGMYWDFNGALPAAWTIVDNTGNNYVWVWSDVGPHGAYTHPLGQPWNVNIDPLASTTGGNGFMLFQADNYNTDQTTGTIAAGYVAHDSYIQTEALDLSSVSSVILKFQQRFRVCCTYNAADLYVSVSNDGTVWKDYEVGSTYQTINYNSSAADDVTDVELNISSAAANQSTVYIRFHIRGLSHYYWMIDDVAITEGPQYDIVIEDYYNNFLSYDNGAYSKIPQAQSTNGPIGWRAAVYNSGGQDLNNVYMYTDVLWNGNTSFLANSSTEYPISMLPALAVGQEDSLSRDTIFLLNDDFYTTSQGLPASFKANCLGTYDVTWTARMDETDEYWSNNVVNTTFMVTDSVFARDNGVPQGSVSTQKWAGQGADGDVFGVTYEVVDPSGTNSVANSISMYINPTTHVNDSAPSIKGVLLMSDGLGGYNPVLETDVYDITPADTATWLTLPFLTDGFSEYLTEGNYIAAIEAVAFNNGDLDIGEDLTTNQIGWATLWHWAADPVTDYYWLTNYSSTPMIRLNFIPWTDGSFTDCTLVGVNSVDNTLENVKMFPNPTSGTLNIKNAEGATVYVYNIMGDLVKTVDVNTITSQIDISDLSNGNYIVKVSNELGITTQKITLVK